MEADAVWSVERDGGVRAARFFVVSDELGGEGWNPGFDDPRFLAGKRRARRLLVDVILRRGASGSSSMPLSAISAPCFRFWASTPPSPKPAPAPLSQCPLRQRAAHPPP